MKVYYVYADKCGYDEFDAVVIIAENEKRALAIVEENDYFYKWQGDIHVEEEDLSTEHIVLESFNAG